MGGLPSELAPAKCHCVGLFGEIASPLDNRVATEQLYFVYFILNHLSYDEAMQHSNSSGHRQANDGTLGGWNSIVTLSLISCTVVVSALPAR